MANLNRNWQSQVAKINIKNVSGETIPPYACCELDYDVDGSATEMDGDEIVFRVTKPTTEGAADSARIVFNSAGKIQDEHIGIAVICPLVQALWDYATDPEIGQSCGATDGEWFLSSGGTGFKIKSIDATEAYIDGDVKTIFAEAAGGGGVKHVYAPSGGIPAASWNSDTEKMTPGKATCRIAVKVGGVYEPTDETMEVENPVGAAVGASGKPMTVGQNTSGAWTVLVEDCTSSSSGPVASNTQAGKLNLNYKLGVGLGV